MILLFKFEDKFYFTDIFEYAMERYQLAPRLHLAILLCTRASVR